MVARTMYNASSHGALQYAKTLNQHEPRWWVDFTLLALLARYSVTERRWELCPVGTNIQHT
jgi:hypothetical protein